MCIARSKGPSWQAWRVLERDVGRQVGWAFPGRDGGCGWLALRSQSVGSWERSPSLLECAVSLAKEHLFSEDLP